MFALTLGPRRVVNVELTVEYDENRCTNVPVYERPVTVEMAKRLTGHKQIFGFGAR